MLKLVSVLTIVYGSGTVDDFDEDLDEYGDSEIVDSHQSSHRIDDFMNRLSYPIVMDIAVAANSNVTDFNFEEFAKAFSPAEVDDACSGDCCKCLTSAGKWYMDKMEEKWTRYCKETKCPWIRKMCEKAANNPKAAFGFLLAHSHAAGMTYAYCAGKGVCKSQPDESSFTDPVTIAEARRLSDESDEAPAQMGGMKKCMRKSMFKVMRKATWHMKHWCSTTQSAKALKMCSWFDKHPEETLGMLISRVQPWKFAMGHCL
jgi:hypothetical protein